MAIIRSLSHLNIKTPPPSPIPTATGSRSAANETFTDFLEKSLQIPDLKLPESHVTRHKTPGPPEIDFRSLALRESSSVERLLESARELGVFRIGCYGIIEEEELREWVKEAGRVFGVLEERDMGFRRHLAGKREEIVWFRGDDERMEWARRYIGAQLYHSFSEKMEKAASKLDKVAEELGQIFAENANNNQLQKNRSKTGETLLSIYKYNHNQKQKQDEMNIEPEKTQEEEEEEENDHSISMDYTLSLHIPTKQCEFSVKSGPLKLLTFDAGPEAIVVTVGKQLEEWSMGEFKCVSGRIIYKAEIWEPQSSFSMELKYSSLNMNGTYENTIQKKISLADQFFIALIIVFFYSFFMSKY